MYNLFLDDVRLPLDAFQYTRKDMFINKYWIVVRNYDEFVSYIRKNGLPFLVSFDHDLAQEHYTPKEYWDDYDLLKEYQERQVYTEKTGYDCANWLMEYCDVMGKRLPKYFSHSQNPVGRDNIINTLNFFNNNFTIK